MDPRTKRKLMIIITVMASFILLGTLGWVIINWRSPLPHSPRPILDDCTQLLQQSLSGSDFQVVLPKNTTEYVGISDGSFIFDGGKNGRPDSELKCLGALQLRLNKKEQAAIYWSEAVLPQQFETVASQDVSLFQDESNDAEALIYREDSYVVTSGKPYITFIVGTIITGNDKRIGQDVLQGAYIAQEEFNRSHTDMQIRLLIANFGSSLLENPTVGLPIEAQIASQIVSVANTNSTVKGIIIGLPYTSNNTLSILDKSQNHTPVLLSGAFSELQLSNTTNIFPISASTEHEGRSGAQFILKWLHIQRVAIFVNADSDYSKTLSRAFKNRWNNCSDSNTIQCSEYPYIGRDHSDANGISELVMTAVKNQNPDLIYFAGDSADADVALRQLQSLQRPDILLMGGDALYELGGYKTASLYKHLYFTSFAYPDQWLAQALPQRPMPNVYRLLFSGWPLSKVYGYSRPDNDAILSCDALTILLMGSEITVGKKDKNLGLPTLPSYTFVDFKPNELQASLISQDFQVFSGTVKLYRRDSKDAIMLCVNKQGFTKFAVDNKTCS